MKSLQALREQIDTYIETKVESVIKDKMATAIEDVLLPMGQAFIEKTLKSRLETMLNEALESSLAELAEEFDVDYIVSSHTEQEDAYAKIEEGDEHLREELDRHPHPNNDHLRLLAFIQFYKEKHGTGSIPGSSAIHSNLGFSSVDLSRLYAQLVEEGFISRKSGKPASLKIINPLADPSDYLDNPLK